MAGSSQDPTIAVLLDLDKIIKEASVQHHQQGRAVITVTDLWGSCPENATTTSKAV
jgi:hypothetical protein